MKKTFSLSLLFLIMSIDAIGSQASYTTETTWKKRKEYAKQFLTIFFPKKK
jgi:hypothetical protein